MKKDIILTCKSVWFYSSFDEDSFFEWLKKISSIKKVKGIHDALHLYFSNNNQISDHDLRELLALFYRYKINMKQLKIFLNKNNREWFYARKKAYWHRRVFGP